jgi:hypothetical protein
MKTNSFLLSLLVILLATSACDDTNPVPKPSTFLRTEFPEHTYRSYLSPQNFSFSLADLYMPKTFEQAKTN